MSLLKVILIGGLMTVNLLAGNKVGKPIKVFTGKNGEIMTIAPVAGSKDKVVIKFEGFNSELDGKLIEHTFHDMGSKADYRFILEDGGEWTSVTVRGNYYDVHLPGKSDSVWVIFNDKKTTEVKSEDMIATSPKLKKAVGK